MAKFCGNCGARLDDDARVCGYCGTFVEPQPGGYTPPKPQTKQPDPRLKKLIPLIAAAVVVIAVLVGVIRYNSPASVAQRFYKATLTNSKRVADMMAYDTQAVSLEWYDGDEEAFFEDQSDWYGEDITSWNDYYKAVNDYRTDELEDEYGKYTVKAEVKKVKDVSAKRIRDDYEYLLDDLEDSAGFNRDNIKAGKRVTMKVTIKGEDDTDRETADVILVRTGLSWKVLTVE